MVAIVTALPSHLTECWGIRHSERIADTRSSLVHRVWRQDGSPAIVKQLKPTGLHELPGMDFLDWRDGSGTVRLLDRQQMACLLEDAGTATLRNHRNMNGEEAANLVIVEVLEKLQHDSAIAAPPQLVPLRQHFRALFEHATRAEHHPAAQALSRCATIAEDLLADQIDIRPLHGDLHHENIVSGSGSGWLAIDPQGLIGDPAYDVANIFGNPDGAFADIVDPARIITLARTFSTAIGCSADKILRYAIAHAGLSICWSLEDGDRLSARGNAYERLAFVNTAATLLDAESL